MAPDSDMPKDKDWYSNEIMEKLEAVKDEMLYGPLMRTIEKYPEGLNDTASQFRFLADENIGRSEKIRCLRSFVHDLRKSGIEVMTYFFDFDRRKRTAAAFCASLDDAYKTARSLMEEAYSFLEEAETKCMDITREKECAAASRTRLALSKMIIDSTKRELQNWMYDTPGNMN